mmetsp:Transcript_9697/g.20935  ORF Transcript_9697/g.20935 Transcript_9697/m.20935 type:complete len:590 (+) Transcript_9697:105-1874(+)
MTAPPSLRAATAKSFLRRRPASSVLAAAAGAAVLIERTASLRDARPLEEAVPSDRFDPRAVSEYWSNRPVSVACRLGTVVCGLGPVAGDYLAAYQIRPRLAPLLGWSGGDGNKDEDEELRRQTALARKLRSALTNLGPTFVKVGQQISIRPDVVPPAVLHELQRLCDAVPPFDDKIAMGVLREELERAASKERKRKRREDGHDENEELAIKGDINDRPNDNLEEEQQEDASNSNNILLEVFESTPRLVASASLGQVYRARLRSTDQDVAVKVQRPDILETVSLDLFLLLSYGRLVDKVCSVLTNQVPYHESFLTDFAAGAYMELNYENEGSNQEYFRSELRKRKGTKDRVVVPRVHGEYTTRRVLVSEWIDGTPLARSSPEQIRRLIPVGVELFLTQLLDIGRFHADPHPGNLYVTKSKEDGTTPVLCLLDFGLVAKVSQDERESMTRAIVNLLRGDYDALISTDAKSLGFLPPDADVTDLRPVLETILRRGLLESGSDMNDRRRNLMAISDELNEVFFRYPFSVPPFFALVTRGLGLLEGIALAGDPDFDIFRASYPYATRRAVEAFGSMAGSDAWRLPRWVCNVAGR